MYTILSNKDGHGRKGTIVSVVSGTKAETLTDVFNRMPEQKRMGVKEVTMDFSDSMRMAVQQSFPNATITVDCFHVVQLATQALGEMRMKYKRKEQKQDAQKRSEYNKRLKRNNELRKERERQRKAEGRKKSPRGRKPNRANQQYQPERLGNGDTPVELLTRSRYLLSQSRDKWTESQKERADIMFSRYPELLEGYELVNRLRMIFKNTSLSVTQGKDRLQSWCDEVRQFKSDRMRTVAVTIESRIDDIANYFDKRHTNASAESLNSKIKGFRSMLRGVSDIEFFMYRVSRIFG